MKNVKFILSVSFFRIMNKKLASIILILVFAFTYDSFSQTIDLGANFSSTNTAFYKNSPGINLGFAYELKSQYFLIGITNSWKNNNYFETSYSDIPPGIISRKIKGDFSSTAINIGIAQKIKNTNELCIAIGGYAGLNYFKFDDYIYNYYLGEGGWYFEKHSRNEIRKNKIGFGGFVEFELKSLFFKNISLFTRINTEYIDFSESRYGGSFGVDKIGKFSVQLGLKIPLVNDKKE
jgi:hypothetical protein